MGLRNCWGFDIDSVVADLSGILERVAREVYGIEVSRSQFTEFRLETCLPYDPEFIVEWISRAIEPHWTAQMEPYPGAVEVLTEVAERQPLLFVTARSDVEPIREWLRGQLVNVPESRIQVQAVGTREPKVPVLQKWGVSYFVEDRVETCDLVCQHGIVPVVFEQPWNVGRHGYTAVRSWSEIRELVHNGGNGGLGCRG